MGPVPRPKGVAPAVVMWTAVAACLGFLTIRSCVTGHGLLRVPAILALVTATVTILLGRGSAWGPGIQLVILVPGLVAFPFAFVAVILLGYMTRAETVSPPETRDKTPRHSAFVPRDPVSGHVEEPGAALPGSYSVWSRARGSRGRAASRGPRGPLRRAGGRAEHGGEAVKDGTARPESSFLTERITSGTLGIANSLAEVRACYPGCAGP